VDRLAAPGVGQHGPAVVDRAGGPLMTPWAGGGAVKSPVDGNNGEVGREITERYQHRKLKYAGHDHTGEKADYILDTKQHGKNPQGPEEKSVTVVRRRGIDLVLWENCGHPGAPTEITSASIIAAADAADERQEQKEANHSIGHEHNGQFQADDVEKIYSQGALQGQEDPADENDSPGVLIDGRPDAAGVGSGHGMKIRPALRLCK
jgi:hypothetical protein